MNGDADVVQLLNEVLTAELTAVNQYFVDARMLDNWGLERLGHHFYEESIGEMKDADELVKRVLYLEGLPNLQRLGTVQIGETAIEKLQLALTLEQEAVVRLNRGIELCTARGDSGTRELLEHILEGEEGHADWLESQLEAVRLVGDANYLAQQLHD